MELGRERDREGGEGEGRWGGGGGGVQNEHKNRWIKSKITKLEN